MLIEKKVTTRQELYPILLEDCEKILRLSITKKNQASMLLSGGTSPGPFYELLSKQDLPWSQVWFSLSDERWVAPDHHDSNARLVRETLLQNEAGKSQFIGLKSSLENIDEGVEETNRTLQKMPKPFDIVLLGMGDDGHTASLFPGAEGLDQALDLSCDEICSPIYRGDGETPRVTMTLKTLLNSREIKILMFGQKKWDVYEAAKQKYDMTLPVSYILNQTDVPVTIYWAAE